MPEQQIVMIVPSELAEELKTEAKARNQTVEELLRDFLRLGFLALTLQKSSDQALLIHDSDGDRELLI